jgi:protein NrfD
MDLSVADPHWGWWIILYFFLGGIAAGAYAVATMIDLFGHEADRDLARVGYWIAFPLILVCGLLLTVDLDQPGRFWHMLFRSEVVEAALRAGWPLSGESWRLMARAPLLKYWSPMSAGSWALTVFGLCSALSLLGSLFPGGRLAWLLRQSFFARLLQLVGCVVGFFVASYTGALATATNQPLWSDTTWIAPLFLASAASTGIATMLLLARFRPMPAESIHRLERADLWAMALELVIFILFCVSLGALFLPVAQTRHGLLLVGGTLIVGLLAPLTLRLLSRPAASPGAVAAAVLALVGGFIMRYALVTTPPELLQRGPALVAGASLEAGPLAGGGAAMLPRFSPEEGRPPGGGPGADPGNYVGEPSPRSRVFNEP